MGAQRQCKLWKTSALAFCSFPCSPSNFIAGHFLSSKLSLLSISCCSLAVPSPPLRFVCDWFFFAHVARVNILPQNRLTLHSSFSVAVSLSTPLPLRCIKYLKLGINCVNRMDNLLSFWLYFVSWTYSVQFLFQFVVNLAIYARHSPLQLLSLSFFWYSWHANDIFYQRTQVKATKFVSELSEIWNFLSFGYVKWVFRKLVT